MGILREKANANIELKYLYYVLSSNMFRKIIQNYSTGSNINNLSNSLGELLIPLPPLDVQRKAVTEIEKVDKEYNTTRMKIETYRQKIEEILNNMKISRTDTLNN